MTDATPLRRRFIRVYFDDIEKDHPMTFYDPTAFGTWVRLLILSEKSWPALPSLPKAIRRADLVTLTRDGLYEDKDNGQFELRGWRKERSARASGGRVGAKVRWDGSDASAMPTQSDRNAKAYPKAMHAHAGASPSISISSREQTTKEETTAVVAPARPSSEKDDRDALDTYYDLTRFRPWGVWSGDAIQGAINEYGDAAVDAAIRAEWELEANRETLLSRFQARLARDAERQRQAKPRKSKAPRDLEAEYVARSRLVAEMLEQTG